jgi:hypothetical protein
MTRPATPCGPLTAFARFAQLWRPKCEMCRILVTSGWLTGGIRVRQVSTRDWRFCLHSAVGDGVLDLLDCGAWVVDFDH